MCKCGRPLSDFHEAFVRGQCLSCYLGTLDRVPDGFVATDYPPEPLDGHAIWEQIVDLYKILTTRERP